MILNIILEIMFPILSLIASGTFLHHQFKFDMKTFSKLILYYYIPALAFLNIYQANLSLKKLLNIFAYLILQLIILFVISNLLSKVLKLEKRLSASFSNSIILVNNGNIGIPLNDLVFHHNPFAMSVQMVVVLFEILTSFTVGLINANSAQKGFKNSLKHFFKLPVFYAVMLGLFSKILHLKIPDFLLTPLETVANGMLAFALVSIGAQLSISRFKEQSILVCLSSFVRLIIAPICSFSLICFLELKGVTAQVLFISSAIPTSRNSVVLALEYDNHPEFAAQALMLSTLLSSFTLTIVIYLSNYIL